MNNFDINKEIENKIDERICIVAERINDALNEYNVPRSFKICEYSLDTQEDNQFEIEELMNNIYFINELFLFKEELFKLFFDLEKDERKYGRWLNQKYTFLRGHNPREEEYNLFTGSFEEQEEIKWKRHLPLETVEKIKEEDKKIDLKDLEKEVWRKVDGFFEN